MNPRINPRKLALARKRIKLPITAVAEFTGTNPTYIGCIESGRIPLSCDSELARQIIEMYGVSIDDVCDK